MYREKFTDLYAVYFFRVTKKMESIQYNNILGENVVLKAAPIKMYKNLAQQRYNRQRSLDSNSSTSSYDRMSPIPAPMMANQIALAGSYQPYHPTPNASHILSYNNFLASAPGMANLAAAAATVEPAINYTISFFKAMNAAPSPYTDQAIDLTKMHRPAPAKMEMSTPSFKPAVASTPVIDVNAKLVIAEVMYDCPRYTELIEAELVNQEKFIQMHLKHFELRRTYSREKVRSVCRSDETPGADGVVDNSRKAEYRKLNNVNSQRR